VEATVREYSALLQALEQDCAEIIQATAGTRAVIQTARQTQDALYDAASKVCTVSIMLVVIVIIVVSL
jgi:hypothetical protein